MSNGRPQTGQARLSRRELEVARLVAEGLTNREIAGRLFVSERTVDGHLEHIREKLGVNSRAQVAAWVTKLETEAELPAPAPAARRDLAQAGSKRLRIWLGIALVFAVVAFALIQLLREPPSPEIVTVAGTYPPTDFVIGTNSRDGIRATTAQLNQPNSLAPAPGGLFYIADYGNRRVRMVDRNQIINAVAGGGRGPLVKDRPAPAISVALAFPSAVALDRTGRLYILTNEGGTLEVWSVGSDTFIKHVVSLPPDNYQPSPYFADPVGGLAVATDGTIYVADRADDTVWAVIPGQEPTLLAGSPGRPGFDGDLPGPASSALLDSPSGLALDQQRNFLYIADVNNDRIRRIDLRTKWIETYAGSGKDFGNSGDGGKASDARLKIPFGVAVAPDGTVYIADTGNNRIRKVTPSGIILPVAGSGVVGFYGDNGPAAAAQLSGPEAVAIDSDGNLLIADTFNQRVRKLLLH